MIKVLEPEQISFLLSLKLEEVSKKEWSKALDEVAPLDWRSSDGGDCQFFFLPTFITGKITVQYYKLNDRYFKKYVDYRIQSTWISLTHIYRYDLALREHTSIKNLIMCMYITEVLELNQPWNYKYWGEVNRGISGYY